MNSWRAGPTNFASRTSSESRERLSKLRLDAEAKAGAKAPPPQISSRARITQNGAARLG
jgi:hypothetical protein